MSARRCSRRSPARRGSCSAASMRARSSWSRLRTIRSRLALGLRCRGGRAAASGLRRSIRSPGPQPRDLAGYDLVLPLVAWGYHQRLCRAGWRLLDRARARRACRSSIRRAAAALEQRQILSGRACGTGVATVPTLAVERADDARSRRSAAALRQRGAGDQAAGLGERLRHPPPRPGDRASRAGPRPAR